jgi:protein-disulfide isomerase
MYQVIFARTEVPSPDDMLTFAKEAGVPDTDAFMDCLTRPGESFQRIQDGRRIGTGTGVTGTPTVWVNGKSVYARDFATFLQAAEHAGVELRR